MISVVIPVFNEEKYLTRCLQALRNQTINDSLEIIVVDNNCTDSSIAIATKYQARIEKESKSGVGAARRKGVDVATGDIVITVDADTELLPNYVEKVCRLLNSDRSLVCLGGMFKFYDAPIWKNILRFLVARPIYLLSWLLSRGKVGPMGNNLAFRLSDYKKTRGFNAELRFGEDMDLVKQFVNFGKVKLDFNLPVRVSARRFLLDKNFAEYSLNLFYYLLTGKPWRNRLPKV